MNITDRQKRIAGLLLFFTGLLLGGCFHALTAWADFEAFLFDTSLQSDRRMSSLYCPAVISPTETAFVSAKFRNTLERDTRLTIQVHTTMGAVTLMREYVDRVDFRQGESKRLKWEIFPDDKVYGRLVLVRVMQMRQHPMPSFTGTCGVLVLNFLGLPGLATTILWVAGAVVLMAGGAFMWARTIKTPINRGPDDRYAVMTLGLLVTAGILMGLVGQWVLAVGLLVVTVVAVFTILATLLLR